MKLLIPFFLSSAVALCSPAWQGQLTSEGPGPHPIISSSTLDYTLSWKGMLKAGKLDIEFAPPGIRKSDSFVIKSSAASLGAASALFPYSHTYWSEVQPKSLRSKYFKSTETDDEEIIVTTNTYRLSEVVIRESSKDLKSGKTTTLDDTFPFGGARDMFSAILHLQSQKLSNGDEHVLLLVPFKSPYLLKVRVEGREQHMGRDSIRLSFSLKKIDRKTHELVEYKKLKKPVTLWLSDDAERLPLELRASIYVGDVRAVLTGYTKHP